MISIIICSKHTDISESLKNNIKNTVGCDYELVVIDNSKNNFSIFTAYNKGVEISKSPYLCFIHDDVEFISQNWGEHIINHLSKPYVGFIGVAGGQAMLRVPFGWTSYNPTYNITHTTYDKNNEPTDRKDFFSPSTDETLIPATVLDGVFLCAKKELFEKIRFDNETFNGFHSYDLDICMQSIQNGYQNFVVFEIELRHFSTGNFDKKYLLSLFRLHEKWEPYLPLFEKSISPKITSKDLYRIEKDALKRLKKRLIRAGMSNKEIYPLIKNFTLLTGTQIDLIRLILFLNITLSFNRIISIFRKKMVYQQFK